MKFCITRQGAGRVNDLVINHDEFERIAKSAEFLLHQLTIEQRYDLLVSNFVDFRKAIHDAAAEHAVRRRLAASEFDMDMAPINRTLLNFLSSARAYVEQLRVSSSPDIAAIVVTLMNAAYDSKLSYRAMEALRNYSQHRGLPIHSFGYSGEWVDSDHPTKARRVERAVPYLNPKDLAKDKSFKKAVLKELLEAEADSFPILPWVKEYLGSLSAIQAQVRALHEQQFIEMCSLRLSEGIRYGKFDKSSLISNVYALALDDRGRIVTELYLGRRLEEAIEALRQANRPLIRFEASEIVT